MADVQVVVVSSDEEVTVVTEAQPQVSVVELVDIGPQGIPGPTGLTGPAGDQHLFIGPDAPVGPPATYLWIETGLGGGLDMTFWVEDAA